MDVAEVRGCGCKSCVAVLSLMALLALLSGGNGIKDVEETSVVVLVVSGLLDGVLEAVEDHVKALGQAGHERVAEYSIGDRGGGPERQEVAAKLQELAAECGNVVAGAPDESAEIRLDATLPSESAAKVVHVEGLPGSEAVACVDLSEDSCGIIANVQVDLVVRAGVTGSVLGVAVLLNEPEEADARQVALEREAPVGELVLVAGEDGNGTGVATFSCRSVHLLGLDKRGW
jgi:hypothetical protein